MSEAGVNIHALDAAYKPFPTFEEWAAKTFVDAVRWDRYVAEIEKRPKSSPDALKRAYEIVKRAAALDTGAIEGLYEVDRGFTFTVAFETAAWEIELAKKGENVRPLFEAQLHAYDYVLDFATKSEPISEAAIRKLHEVVCGAQETYRVMTSIGPREQKLVKGRYKVLPNHVRTRDGLDHSYAPVDVTPPEMARLVSEMRSETFLAAHPVIQAAYAHYGLVVIHPFADGNGRVARALASAFTYRAVSMPIMMLSEHKSSYLDALEEADTGNYEQFVNFMLARSLDTIAVVKDSMHGAAAPNAEEVAAAINDLFTTKGGYTEDQVDRAGNQLLELVKDELEKNVSKNKGSNLQGRATVVVTGAQNTTPDPRHRLPAKTAQDLTVLQVELTSNPPAYARVFRNFVVWVPINASSDDDVQVMLESTSGSRVFFSGPESDSSPRPDFSARIDELIPVLSGVLQIRMTLFAERIVGAMLSELKRLVEKSLRGQD